MIVNAAASYGGSHSHISLHFGYAVSQDILIWKLNTLYPYSCLIVKTSTSLNGHISFIIAVFDNS